MIAHLAVALVAAFSRPIETAKPDAQRAFDEGMLLLYGFNHAEAQDAFARCSKLDPHAAMCRWGTAVAAGPHINNAHVEDDENRAALQALRALDGRELAPVVRALVDAQKRRYAADNPSDRRALDTAYADAMREVAARFPQDPDVLALFAESLLDLRPWDQWTASGAPQPGTEDVLRTLEAALKIDAQHPLANHLYVHALEASPFPERADAAAERLRTLAPTMGHLVHMPSHIDVRRGRWGQAVAANQAAISADSGRLKAKRESFYRLYIAHDFHMLAFASMMSGRSKTGIDAIMGVTADMPASWKRSPIADYVTALRYEVLVRFGKWDDILQLEVPPKRMPLARTMALYARGVAYAAHPALRDIGKARAEQARMREAAAVIPAELSMGINPAKDVVLVGDRLLDAEILVAEGRLAEALTALQAAVAAEDALRYDEPAGWMMPTRHVLGAALLKAGKTAEAERVYREDLARWPDNVWSLWGLSTSLRAQGPARAAEAQAADTRLQSARAGADIELMTSCFCLPGP